MISAKTINHCYSWCVRISLPFPYRCMSTVLRVEHRFDDSTGVGGGFFKNGELRPGVAGLAPGQHLLLLGCLSVSTHRNWETGDGDPCIQSWI